LSTIKLHLFPNDGKRFQVIATIQGEGEAEIEASLPFFTDENEKEKDWRSPLLRCLEMTAFNSQYFQEDEQEWMVASGILDENRHNFTEKYLKNIGQSLYQALFPPDSNVKNAFLASLRSHEQENTQLHIQLSFAEDVVQRSRLADYPWELLHDGKGFVLLNRNVTISRYIAYEGVPPKLPPTEKINVLLVSSSASDTELGLNKLGESEVQAIAQGLEKARNDGHINFVQLSATRDNLRAYLTEHRGEDAPQVLHFDGHGLYGKRCTNPQCRAINKGNRITKCRKCDRQLPEAQGYLVFEDGNGGADYVSAEKLGTLLSKSTLGDGNNKSGGIALVVLSACQSAMTVEGDSVFNGTAQNLIGQRIPSVVAMQYSVSVASATEFANQFYRSLGQKNSLGIAVSQAREAMEIEDNHQWYRPVLYLRWQDNQGGQLFKTSSVRSGDVSDCMPIYQSTESPSSLNSPKISLEKKSPRQKLRIQEELTDLQEEREACNSQYRSAIDEAERVRLKRKLDNLDKKIDDLERQLNEL
jgi:CHAT domain-containing protein